MSVDMVVADTYGCDRHSSNSNPRTPDGLLRPCDCNFIYNPDYLGNFYDVMYRRHRDGPKTQSELDEMEIKFRDR